MTIVSESGYLFCRYAEGHPFRDPQNPEGFRLAMLRESGDDPQDDQLFIDFHHVGSKLPHSLEADWYCYERVR